MVHMFVCLSVEMYIKKLPSYLQNFMKTIYTTLANQTYVIDPASVSDLTLRTKIIQEKNR